MAAGVMAHEPGAVVVSQTMKIWWRPRHVFQDLGARPLKGVMGEWRLYHCSPRGSDCSPQVEPGIDLHLAPLSHRERVATLVALGLSNARSQRISSSPGRQRAACRQHPQRWLPSRAQIAAWTAGKGYRQAAERSPSPHASPHAQYELRALSYWRVSAASLYPRHIDAQLIQPADALHATLHTVVHDSRM
jgi:hypothetical protein